ncbi:MAG TPA: hypothetical protein GX710_01865, partial [Clostridiales bacterium]|nr:hypothetical protein [Clostridiales bacterium]
DTFLILSSELPYERILSSDFDDIFFTQSDLDNYIKSLGHDVPESMFDLMYVIYSLTWDDFNIRSKSDAQVFKALAIEKTNINTTVILSDPFYYETDEVKGFISINKNIEKGLGFGSYTANLFSVKDPLQNITITGKVSDINTFYGIVNSVTVN